MEVRGTRTRRRIVRPSGFANVSTVTSDGISWAPEDIGKAKHNPMARSAAGQAPNNVRTRVIAPTCGTDTLDERSNAG